MRIKKMEIYGYGKWHDKTFWMDNGINVIVGQNEAGKTTLASFIHSILFGFPTKQSTELRYEPKDSSRYGGKIWLEDSRYGIVEVERVSGKATGNVSIKLENGEKVPAAFLDTILYKIQKDWYQSVFSFNLDGLTDIKQMNEEKLNRYFLSAGTLGSESFLKEADRLEAEAGKLYKPMGRKPALNVLLKEYEKSRKELGKAKEMNEQYATLLEKRKAFIEEIDLKEKEKEAHLQQMRKLKEIMRNWTQLEEMKRLNQLLQEIPKQMLPPDSLYQLEQWMETAEKAKEQVFEVKEKLLHNQEIYQVPPFFLQYQDHKEDLEKIERELDTFFEHIHHYSSLEEKEALLQQEENEERFKIGLSPLEEIPTEPSVKSKEQLFSLVSEKSQVIQSLSELKEQLSFLIYRQDSLSIEVDSLEQNLWSHEQLEKAAAVHHEEGSFKTPPDKSNVFKSMIAVCLFVASILLFLSIKQVWGWSVLVGGGTLSFYFFFSSGFSKKNKSASFDRTDYERYVRQTQLREDWRGKLAELDKIEQEIRNHRSKEQELEYQIQSNDSQINEWRDKKRIPASVSMEKLLSDQELFTRLSSLQEQREKIVLKKSELNAKLQTWLDKAMEYALPVDRSSDYSLVYKRLRQYFEEVHAEEKRQQQFLYKSEQLQDTLRQLVRDEQRIKKQLNKLLNSAGVSSEKEFRERFAEQQIYLENKERYLLLKQQFKEEENLFQNFLSKEELTNRFQELTDQLKQTEEETKVKINERIGTEATIQKLEESGEYSELLQRNENIKSEITETVQQWAGYKVAASLIERTLNHAKKDRLPATVQDTERYFNILTDGEYIKAEVKEDVIEVQRKDGTVFHPHELSRGTAEQLYAALRLAFVKNIAEKMPLPILIDDGFVNFDQKRKQEMWKLLNELSQFVQILYFTFEDPETKEFTESNYIRL